MHSLPFVCFGCRKSFKVIWSGWSPGENNPEIFRRRCPECGEELYYGGRYFKTPPQNAVKQWAKVRLLWEKGWFTQGMGFRGNPKSLHDAQNALVILNQLARIEKKRQKRSEAYTKWRRASRRRRDF